MKKIITILFFIASLNCVAQDSTNVTVSVNARDLEYIGSFAFNDNSLELVFDTLKLKFRVQNPPAGNTPVSITALTIDWLTVMQKLKNDATAIKGGCTNRVETLLRAVGQVYLTGKLDTMDTADGNTFGAMRQFGRFKLRRQQ